VKTHNQITVETKDHKKTNKSDTQTVGQRAILITNVQIRGMRPQNTETTEQWQSAKE